jgi:hypothetical protein
MSWKFPNTKSHSIHLLINNKMIKYVVHISGAIQSTDQNMANYFIKKEWWCRYELTNIMKTDIFSTAQFYDIVHCSSKFRFM